MHPYIVETVTREHILDQLCEAQQVRAGRRSGRRPESVPVAPVRLPLRPRYDLHNNLRHPVGAFRSWLTAGLL